jgi:hypothetical protein
MAPPVFFSLDVSAYFEISLCWFSVKRREGASVGSAPPFHRPDEPTGLSLNMAACSAASVSAGRIIVAPPRPARPTSGCVIQAPAALDRLD